ncbi:MAG: hypothetical protein MUE53_09440 [Chitinophagales bacterium]|jgi:hypothetical protein|nr:hypothetical protein [Chitinophagales bacterium]
MKNLIIIFTLSIFMGCDKNDSTNTATQTMTPCTIENKGIYVSSQPKPNGAINKINTFKIDSVVLKENKFTLWFTEDGSKEKFRATLRRYDKSKFQSGLYYFLDSANQSFQPPYVSMSYPVVYFAIKSLNKSEDAYFLYDSYEVCVSNENGKFGILIDGIKVADTRSGEPSVFLTFSLDNTEFINR